MLNSNLLNIYLKMDKDTYFSLMPSDGIANRTPRLEEVKTLKHIEYDFEGTANIEIIMPISRKELKKFVEIFHPSLCLIAWWESHMGRNNWRKMHGLPMIRKRSER